MLRRIINVIKTKGFIGLSKSVHGRFFPKQVSSFKNNEYLFSEKIGLEIGGPSTLFKKRNSYPVYTVAKRIDNCNFSSETTWEGAIEKGATFNFNKNRTPGIQYVTEATNLNVIESNTYDILLSSHTLEHIANPLKALAEWLRVLKTEGILTLVLPHKDATFDHKRPITKLSHLVEDFNNNVGEDDMTHFDEIMDLHDLSLDPAAGDIINFRARSEQNLENRCFHHHVFNTPLCIELIDHIGLQIISVDTFVPNHILIVAKKISTDQNRNNNKFTHDYNGKKQSPFPSDYI